MGAVDGLQLSSALLVDILQAGSGVDGGLDKRWCCGDFDIGLFMRARPQSGQIPRANGRGITENDTRPREEHNVWNDIKYIKVAVMEQVFEDGDTETFTTLLRGPALVSTKNWHLN